MICSPAKKVEKKQKIKCPYSYETHCIKFLLKLDFSFFGAVSLKNLKISSTIKKKFFILTFMCKKMFADSAALCLFNSLQPFLHVVTAAMYNYLENHLVKETTANKWKFFCRKPCKNNQHIIFNLKQRTRGIVSSIENAKEFLKKNQSD